MEALIVKPATREVVIGETRLQLTAMSGLAAVEWLEIQVLAARQRVEAARLCAEGDEGGLREAIYQLVCADVALVCQALGCDPGFAAGLSDGEKQLILAAQDELNRVESYAPFLALQQQAAQVFARG